MGVCAGWGPGREPPVGEAATCRPGAAGPAGRADGADVGSVTAAPAAGVAAGLGVSVGTALAGAPAGCWVLSTMAGAITAACGPGLPVADSTPPLADGHSATTSAATPPSPASVAPTSRIRR